jgi:hypothetical protein
MKPLCLAICLSALVVTTAQAAPIYRCGQTYSQTPCPGGNVIDSSDPRTAAQRAEAKRAVAKEKELARKLEGDRKAKEAAEAASAAGIDTRAAPPAAAPSRPIKGSATSKSKAKTASKSTTGDFIALVPAAAKPAKN